MREGRGAPVNWEQILGVGDREQRGRREAEEELQIYTA